MATQTNSLTVGNNPDAIKENMRDLISIDSRRNNFYTYFGDMDDSRAVNEYVADYDFPGKVTEAELAGVAGSADVVDKNFVPTQVYNQGQRIVTRASPSFDVQGNAVPGMLGNVGEQAEKLLTRTMNAIDVAGTSNIASKKATSSVGGVAGSPATFFGNGDATVADNPGLMTLGSGVGDITDGGGYDSDTKLSSAIDDRTAAGDRGTASLTSIVKAVAAIDKSLDSNTVSGGRLRDEGYVAFVPSDAYQLLFTSANPGILNQNSFETTIGGQATTILSYVQSIDSPYGKITVLPVTNQVGGANDDAGNQNIVVMRGDATEIIYGKRPYIKELMDDPVNDVAVARSNFTFKPPHASMGVVILGVR